MQKKIAEIAGSNSDAQNEATKLFELAKYLENGVKIVRLNVQSESNAYTVFETLNDRGLDLSVLDLIKNYLYGKAGGKIALRDIQTRWSQMMANLINVRADEFLKSWWTSRNGRVQTPELFSRFKYYVANAETANSVSMDMLSTSEQYAALEISDDPMWAGYSQPTKEGLRALKLLGAQQVHPIILSALEKFNQNEIERLIRLLEIMIVRYQLIGGGRTGRLEISCARLAHRIFDATCKTATQSFELLKDVFPSDSEFRDAFKTKQERNSQKARYLLSRIEKQVRLSKAGAASGTELDPSDSLTLEHVFPKSPSQEWSESVAHDPSLAEDCTYRLGNLCLLTNINRSLGSKSFEDKKKVFSTSNLIMTKEISQMKEWNREAIEKRQAEMAKIAVACWRFN